MILDDYLDMLVDDPNDTFALTKVCLWVIEDFNKRGHNPSEYEIYEKIQLLVADQVCSSLVKQGMLDVLLDEKGQVSYLPTEKGLKALDNAENP